MNAKSTRKGQGRSGGRRQGPKRPYSTIDLKATDVTPAETGRDAAKTAKVGAAATAADSAFKAPDKRKGAAAASPSGKDKGAASLSGSKQTTATATGPKLAGSGGAKSGRGDSAASGTGAHGAGAGGDGAGGTSAPPAPPAKAKSGGGFGSFISHMAAGIIGAVLTLLAANYAGGQLGLTGLLPGSSAPAGGGAAPELARRVGSLEKALAARPAAGATVLAPQLAAAEKRLAELEGLAGKVETLGAAQGQLKLAASQMRKKLGDGGMPVRLAGRLGQLEQTLKTLGAAASADPNNAGRIPQLAAISGRVNDLETALGTRLTELRRDVVQEIDSRVAATSEAAEAARSGTLRLGRDMAAIKTGATKMDQRLIDLGASTGQMRQTLRVVQEHTGGLKAGLEGLGAKMARQFKSVARPGDVSAAISPVSAKISALEQNLQGVVKSEQDRQATAQRIVLALELGRLKRAMDRGQNFGPELAEVKRVAGARLDLSALEAHQSSGVPALGELQKGFRALSYRMIDGETIKQNASVMDRLMRGARSMVRVRKVNHSADNNSAEAIVGRMEEALQDGRLSDVLTAAARLPAGAKAPAKAWLKKVKARQLVDQALAGIEDKLKASLSGKPLSGKPLDGAPLGGKPPNGRSSGEKG